MRKAKSPQSSKRMIHIRLSEALHKRLRIRVAELDTTIQDWVAETIEKELNRHEENTETPGRKG
jgi:predicted HicB family RNase H-like nuclease